MIHSPNPSMAKWLSDLQNIQTSSRANPSSYSMGIRAFSWGSSGQGMTITAHLCLLPRLRTSVAIPPLPHTYHHGMYRVNFTFSPSLIINGYSQQSYGQKNHSNCGISYKLLEKGLEKTTKKLTDATDFSCANSWLSWDILSLSFTIVSWRDIRHSLSILRSPSMLEFCTSFAAICCPSFRDDSSAAVRSLSHCLCLISHQHSGTGMGMGNKNQK